jgi:predicted ATPase with chaperone activity
MSTDTLDIQDGLLATLLTDDAFWPSEPRSIEDTGLSATAIEALICKYLLAIGTNSGHGIAEHLCLPFGILESIFNGLRTRQIIVHGGSAPFNDYYYTLTETGRNRARSFQSTSGYIGPAPVPLMDYVISVEAQTIAAEAPGREQLQSAMAGISVDEALYDAIGPAVNSGAGMFLYGAPGNGKSTLAKRLIMCFGQEIWVPYAVVEDGQLIKLYDASYHTVVEKPHDSLIKAADFDRRWIKVKRPTVVVGGELTIDNLEIRTDKLTNVSEAPLQMKANCGCMLIDDFGRQRIDPDQLLNRWIVPLEARHDFLTLPTGKKIQIPFELLILFSTNLEPRDLVDEAFLRRLPYKVEVGDPNDEEFHRLFQIYADHFDCEYRPEVVEYLLDQHYRADNRARRRCHPRDLLLQVKNYCSYQNLPFEMTPDYLDRAVKTYFTDVLDGSE